MKASVTARNWAAGAFAAARVGRSAAFAIVAIAALAPDFAGAADLGYAPRGPGFPGYGPPPPPLFAYTVDPRCSIVPMPQSDLVGDTARFRATAVCQSRGLYTDLLMFPGAPVLYRGYFYGHEQ